MDLKQTRCYRVWTGFMWIRIRASGGLLWTQFTVPQNAVNFLRSWVEGLSSVCFSTLRVAADIAVYCCGRYSQDWTTVLILYFSILLHWGTNTIQYKEQRAQKHTQLKWTTHQKGTLKRPLKRQDENILRSKLTTTTTTTTTTLCLRVLKAKCAVQWSPQILSVAWWPMCGAEICSNDIKCT
jgi:apolipoprotein N-acyltransferase